MTDTRSFRDRVLDLIQDDEAYWTPDWSLRRNDSEWVMTHDRGQHVPLRVYRHPIRSTETPAQVAAAFYWLWLSNQFEEVRR